MAEHEGTAQPRWSVGDVARLSGLTVRTLHHYDELGLLRPSVRTASGRRRYSDDDLDRLYRIRLLRKLGMALDEIAAALDDPAALRAALAGNLARLDDQIWRMDVLRRQTRELLGRLDDPGGRGPDRLLAVSGCRSVFDDALTREQTYLLHDRAADLGERGRRDLDAEWPVVLNRLVDHYRAADPVDSPGVRETADRLAGVVDRFAGHDPELLKTVGGFFREYSRGIVKDVVPGFEDVDDGFWDYVSRVVSR